MEEMPRSMTALRSISSTELRAVFVVDGVEQAVQMSAAAAAKRRNKCFIPGLSGMPAGIPVFCWVMDKLQDLYVQKEPGGHARPSADS